jgi:hypothetical protein
LYFFSPLVLSSQERVWILPSIRSWVPFLDVVADDFGGALEADDIMPLGLVGPVALGVFLPVGGGEREAGDSHAAGGGTDLGVFADVAEEEDFIDAFCHFFDAPDYCGF